MCRTLLTPRSVDSWLLVWCCAKTAVQEIRCLLFIIIIRIFHCQQQAAVSFLNSRKPQPAAERHICEVGSVKFKPRDKRTHSPAKSTTTSKKSGSDPAAATGPRLSHLGSVETFETDISPMGAAPADNGAPLLPPAQSSVTQFKKKKKKKKNKVQRRARTLQTF